MPHKLSWLKRAFSNRRLLWMVIVPILVTSAWLLLISKERYVSDADVVVKRSSDIEGGSLNIGLLLGASNPVAAEDARYLKEYLLSADVLHRIEGPLQLKKELSSGGLDVFNHLPADATREQYLKAYQDRIRLTLDEKTSILTIRAIGFTPAYALKFNKLLLSEAEKFINEMSHRIAREQMDFAKGEADSAYERLSQSKENLLTFQNVNGTLDPVANAEAASRVIAELQAKRTQLETEQRNLLTYLNRDTPQVKAAQNAIVSIGQQIEQEKAKLASSQNNNKLNRKAAEFEELKARVDFDAHLYKSALTAIEKVRIESARKLKNLVVITSPQLAQEAEYPRKLYVLGTMLLCLLLLYGITGLVMSIIEDHKD